MNTRLRKFVRKLDGEAAVRVASAASDDAPKKASNEKLTSDLNEDGKLLGRVAGQRTSAPEITARDVRQILEATLFAAHAHKDQVREDKRDPYLVHLSEVAAMCASIEPLDQVLVTAAWLHDTLEYTDTDESALREKFGKAVADLVADVSDPRELKGKPRRQRQVVHTAKAGIRTKRLKLADRTSNVEEILNAPDDLFRAKSGARYLKWSRRVVDVCRGAAPKLEARFDQSAMLLQARIHHGRNS